jgi:hypothetical protein
MHDAMRRFLLTAAVLGLVVGWAGQSKAALILETDYDPNRNFNTHPGQPVRYDAGTYGYSFAVGSNPLSVTTLATAYAGAQGNVRIYEPGTTTNVALAFITGAQTDVSQNGNPYGYTAITPVLLSANTTYDIVWDNPFFGQAYSPQVPGSIVLNPDLTFGSGVSSLSIGAFPTTDQVGQGAYFGPSFVAALAPAAVPEPSTLASAGIAGLIGCGVAWRRRKRTA